MAKYERKIIMGTSIQTGAVRLDHYNAWLLDPNRAVGGGTYPGFPEDVALESANKRWTAVHIAKKAATNAVKQKKPAVKVRRAVAGSPTKLDRAKELYARAGVAVLGKQAVIEMFCKELDMTAAGASTYYYKVK